MHNAYRGASPHRLEDVDLELWDRNSRTAVWGSYYSAVLAFPHLRDADGRGRLILITSPSGVEGSVNIPIYSPVKAAQRAIAKSLSREWGPLGITVNCIAPVAASPALVGAFEQNPVLEERVDRAHVAAEDRRPRARHRAGCRLPRERRRWLRDGPDDRVRRRQLHGPVMDATSLDAALALRPDLREPLDDLLRTLRDGPVEPALLDACDALIRHRVGVPVDGPVPDVADSALDDRSRAVLVMAEQFVVDPHGIDPPDARRRARPLLDGRARHAGAGVRDVRRARPDGGSLDPTRPGDAMTKPRHRIPPDVLEQNPEAAAGFWRLYGILWSQGDRRPADEGGRAAAERAHDRLQLLQGRPLRGRTRGRAHRGSRRPDPRRLREQHAQPRATRP